MLHPVYSVRLYSWFSILVQKILCVSLSLENVILYKTVLIMKVTVVMKIFYSIFVFQTSINKAIALLVGVGKNTPFPAMGVIRGD